jgi:hypothetical protein
MAIRLSTGIRTALAGHGGAGTGGTGGLATLLQGGVIDIFTGSQPASADYVETGTKLVRISSTCGTRPDDGLKFGTAASGILSLTTPKWQGEVIVDGVAGWGRFYGTTGTSGSSSTTWRLDFNCGVTGADLALTHTSLEAETILTIKEATFEIPAE